MSPTKRTLAQSEIAALAVRLGADWTPGHSLMLWLRKHVDELTCLVHDEGLTWGDIGRALDAAGIGYSTGRPWSAPILRAKAKLARDANARRASERAKRDAASQIGPVAELLKAALTELARPPVRRSRKERAKPAAAQKVPDQPAGLPEVDDDDGIVITPAGGPRLWKPKGDE